MNAVKDYYTKEREAVNAVKDDYTKEREAVNAVKGDYTKKVVSSLSLNEKRKNIKPSLWIWRIYKHQHPQLETRNLAKHKL